MFIVNANINLSKIPKHKIFEGKKGKYVELTLKVYDEVDEYGNHGSIAIAQTPKERENKDEITFLGNNRVLFTDNSDIVIPQKNNGGSSSNNAVKEKEEEEDELDLPF